MSELFETSHSSAHARFGRVLFLIYALFYATFVLLCTFFPETMDWAPLAGINLAVWSGFGLIGGALILALIYGVACRPKRVEITTRFAEGGDRRNPRDRHPGKLDREDNSQ